MRPPIDTTLTITPVPPRARKCGTTAWAPFIAPTRSTSTRRRCTSGGISSNAPHRLVPALLTHTSTPPKAATAASTTSRIRPASVTSPGTASARPPSASHCRAASSSRSRPRATSTTLSPRRAKARAVLNPIPLDPPVMTTVRSALPLCTDGLPTGSDARRVSPAGWPRGLPSRWRRNPDRQREPGAASRRRAHGAGYCCPSAGRCTNRLSSSEIEDVEVIRCPGVGCWGRGAGSARQRPRHSSATGPARGPGPKRRARSCCRCGPVADGGDPSLEELARLADTDGLTVVGELTQARDRPDPATYLGSGKVQELAGLVKTADADVVVV